MKTTLIIKSAIIFCLAICLGCSKDSLDQISEPTLITDCFQFKDGETDLPLEGVFVVLNIYDTEIFSHHSLYYNTDATGMVCWEHKIGETIINWFATIDHYEDTGCYNDNIPLPNIVSMKKASYYKFIIKNIEPQSVNDEIKVKSLDLTCAGTFDITLLGSDIDTTIIRETRSGNSYVNWESKGANVQNVHLQTFTQSRDTTTVEIEY